MMGFLGSRKIEITTLINQSYSINGDDEEIPRSFKYDLFGGQFQQTFILLFEEKDHDGEVKWTILFISN